ncbi:hypothetical protein ABH945_003416 [Paraburkholderia sp. GAS333]
MRIKTLLGFGVTTVASALTLQCGPAWADGPETAYADEDAPAASLSPNEYQVNADGMKEDPNAKMSDVARAYRNGYINRGKEDQAGYNAMIDSHNHGQRQPAKTDVARVDVPPLPAGVPEDDNSKYTSIPAQPRQYAQRQVPQPPQQPQQYQPQPQYRQAYQAQQYAPAPMQYQPAPQYVQAQPQPVYADSQPVYVRQDYAPPPVQYVPVYGQQQYMQPQYEEMPVVDVMQPMAPPVAYQVYRPPVYVATPRMYAYRAQPVMSYGMWR